MKILISNDDGVQNPAIWSLVRTLKPLGEIVVVAPDRNRSGVGTGLTLNEPIRVSKWPSEVDGVDAWAVEGGTPGDSVISGLRHVTNGDVDAVVTGYNPGNNVSIDLLVSGTVGGALQGYLNGYRTMATSVALAEHAEDPVVQEVTRAAVRAMLEKAKAPSLYNLNFPRRLSREPLKGVRKTVSSPRLVMDHLEPTTDEQGRDAFWVVRRAGMFTEAPDLPEDCDIRALRDGYVSLASLRWNLTPNEDDSDIDGIVAAAAKALSGVR